MDSGSAPQAPDPNVVAAAQGRENKEAALLTAQLNRANQYTPYGSLTWTQGAPTRTFNEQRYNDALKSAQYANPMATGHYEGSGDSATWVPGNPGAASATPDRNADQFYDMTPSADWSSKIDLDPRIQSLLDAQLATSKGLAGATESALGRVNETFGKAAPMPSEDLRRQVSDAYFQRAARTLDPSFKQQEERLRSDLMNRGITEMSDPFATQVDTFNRSKNDAYELARSNADLQGGNEMAKQYEMEMAGRNAVMNELNALRSGAQVQNPSFQNTNSGATVNAAPYAQAAQNAYQGQLGAYNADVSSNNAMMGGLASLGAAGIGAYGAASGGAALAAMAPALAMF